ncbi:MAG: DUF4393 domain-containing protein [Ruminococcus sp.]|nr:DUF4393 domain-containing protein [Ruminococcus sp.]
MSENNNSLINIPNLPPSIDNAIQNLTDKPTRSIATTFSDLWDLIFGGISYLSEKKKIKYAHSLILYREQLESSKNQIPPEKYVEPSTQITAQALENSKYCIEEENLRDMFVALISNSMNSDFQNDIHPSFAEIIKQMSSLDAEIIRVFKNSPINGFPLARYQLSKELGGFSLLLEHVFLKYKTSDLDANSLSISSLSRLGLLTTSYSTSFDIDSYKPFTEHPRFKMLQEKFPDEIVSSYPGIVSLTPLGRSFTRVCVPD